MPTFRSLLAGLFGTVALVLPGCTDDGTRQGRPAQPDPSSDLLPASALETFAASGPADQGEAFWSGVPVPRLSGAAPYEIDDVDVMEVEGAGGRVRVGITPTALPGATSEPPDAFRFLQLPLRVSGSDEGSFIAIAVEPGDDVVAAVGVDLQVTLESGRQVSIRMPVSVVACPTPDGGVAASCTAESDLRYERMKDGSERWGVIERGG